MTGLRSFLPRRRGLIGAGVIVVGLAVGTIVLVNPFAGTPASRAGNLDNGVPTSTVSVAKRDLSSQTQVSATLGYADVSTVAVPAGTAPSNVQQAEQAVSSARSALQAAKAGLTSDRQALGQARATLAADARKLAIDCHGSNAAESGSTNGSGGSAAGACVSGAQAVATDEQAVSAASAKVQTDQAAVAAAATAVGNANQSLSPAEASAAVYGPSSAFTKLPAVGQIVTRGQVLYGIDGEPAVLLYGASTAWRGFRANMPPGKDVAELNANLRALGFGAPSGSRFTSATAAAIKAFQSTHGMEQTGVLLLGAVVFEPGAVRVTSVTPAVGAPVQAGPVLGITSTRRLVTIALDASQQTSVKVGDPVTITLPDNSTTPGHVSLVGTVATTPSDQGGGGPTSPTIEVDVEPDDPAATGRLDQAPVDVSITTATVRDVLVVPVNALVALAGGGYAVEEAGAAGARRLVAVDVGLFDDAEGLVQVSGAALSVGQRVVVPTS